MPNKTRGQCPRCGNEELDTLAILKTEKTKSVLFRCLKCFHQFEKPLKQAKEDNLEISKYFDPEVLKDA